MDYQSRTCAQSPWWECTMLTNVPTPVPTTAPTTMPTSSSTVSGHAAENARGRGCERERERARACGRVRKRPTGTGCTCKRNSCGSVRANSCKVLPSVAKIYSTRRQTRWCHARLLLLINDEAYCASASAARALPRASCKASLARARRVRRVVMPVRESLTRPWSG